MIFLGGFYGLSQLISIQQDLKWRPCDGVKFTPTFELALRLIHSKRMDDKDVAEQPV